MQYNVLLANLSNIAHIHFPWYPDQTLTQKKLQRLLCEVASWAPRPAGQDASRQLPIWGRSGPQHTWPQPTTERGHVQQPHNTSGCGYNQQQQMVTAKTNYHKDTTNNNVWSQPKPTTTRTQPTTIQCQNQQPNEAKTNTQYHHYNTIKNLNLGLAK